MQTAVSRREVAAPCEIADIQTFLFDAMRFELLLRKE